jgi:hypothetical protein
MTWKLSRDGLSASRTLNDGGYESRLVSAIPADELATALPADPLTPTEQSAVIQAQIDSLERGQMLPRVSREGLLLTMETFAAMQSVTPAQLYASNIAYHKTKDFDTQIVLLRAQL